MRFIPFLLTFFILLFPVVINPQMPDWKYFKDREGNSYYYDRTFKIRIPDTSGTGLIPVTASGIDFYFNTGVELINEGKYPEGLFYLKSIRTLGSSNNRIRKAQIEAAKWMNYLERKHGPRYELYDSESSITITGENDRYYLSNSKLFYGMTIQHRPHLLKKEWKYNGTGYGLKFGAKIDEKGNYEGFDYITGIESRILKGGSPTIEEAYNIWTHELGADTFSRKEIFRGTGRVLYEVKYPDGTPFSCIEGIYVSRNRIHLARVFFHETLSGVLYESLKLMLQRMAFVD